MFSYFTGKPLTATLFTLVFENKIIMTEVTNPVSAISAWFAIYYILNLKYPEGHSNVLEFVQRCVYGYNPGDIMGHTVCIKMISTHL